MKSSKMNPRLSLLRESAIFQIKLLVDGLRDAFLIPVALLATLIGLVRGGKEPDREFRRVIKAGRRSERWINLFGNQRPLVFGKATGSMDRVLNEVEAIVVESYKKGKSAAETRSAVKDALRDNGSKNPKEDQ